MIERIASYIPGYAGYKEREIRREADALVRRRIASDLAAAKAKLALPITSARQVASNPDAMYLWDAARAWLDRVIQRIDKAPEGYSGFFDLVKVDEQALDRLYEMDLSLLDKASAVAKAVDEVAALQPASEDWMKKMRELISLLSQLDASIDERSNYIAGLAGVRKQGGDLLRRALGRQ